MSIDEPNGIKVSDTIEELKEIQKTLKNEVHDATALLANHVFKLKEIQKTLKNEVHGATALLANHVFKLGLDVPMDLSNIDEVKSDILTLVLDLYISSCKIKQLQHQAKTKELN